MGDLINKSLELVNSSYVPESKANFSGKEVISPVEVAQEQLEGQSIFARVLSNLKLHLTAEAYNSWFCRMQLAEYSKASVQLSVPTAFLRSWINNHYSELLFELWKAECPSLMHMDIVVRRLGERVQTGVSEKQETALEGRKARASHSLLEGEKANFKNERQDSLGSPLDKRYTLKNFVEGSSNRLALAAARSVAELGAGEGKIIFNPLFLHASVGMGKTHLLQAIAWEVLHNSPQACVVYLTAEYFMWRFATAIRDNATLSLKEQLRHIDLLIIDDMQFLQGRAIQNEFCHLLNALLDSAKQVVIAADCLPSGLQSLDVRVRSRLQNGVALEIGRPDYEMRLTMLRQRLAFAQKSAPSLFIPDEVLSYIAEKVSGSCRNIEGAFNQLLFQLSFDSKPSFDRINEMLGHLLLPQEETKQPRIEEVQRLVAKHYNVSKQDLLSMRRTRSIVRPRQIAMYLSKEMTSRSLPEIGRRFGNRDHTTVLHAVRKIEELLKKDTKMAQELELLQRFIKEKTS